MDLPDLRVRLEIFESNTAFLGTLEGFVTRAAEAREMRSARMNRAGDQKGRKTWRPVIVEVLEFHACKRVRRSR